MPKIDLQTDAQLENLYSDYYYRFHVLGYQRSRVDGAIIRYWRGMCQIVNSIQKGKRKLWVDPRSNHK